MRFAIARTNTAAPMSLLSPASPLSIVMTIVFDHHYPSIIIFNYNRRRYPRSSSSSQCIVTTIMYDQYNCHHRQYPSSPAFSIVIHHHHHIASPSHHRTRIMTIIIVSTMHRPHHHIRSPPFMVAVHRRCHHIHAVIHVCTDFISMVVVPCAFGLNSVQNFNGCGPFVFTSATRRHRILFCVTSPTSEIMPPSEGDNLANLSR